MEQGVRGRGRDGDRGGKKRQRGKMKTLMDRLQDGRIN